jgi:hypothetical protein
MPYGQGDAALMGFEQPLVRQLVYRSISPRFRYEEAHAGSAGNAAEKAVKVCACSGVDLVVSHGMPFSFSNTYWS